MDSAAVDRAVEDYRGRQPLLELYCNQIKTLLEQILDGEGRPYQQVESRCKSPEAFREKVIRKKYVDPEREMTDAVGLRIIMFYDSDVTFAAGLIRRQFDVDEANSEDKRAPAEGDRFGYRSYHLVATLREDRGHLAEWQRFAGIQAEIQIRTVLAHAWAAIDHQLGYKTAPGLSVSGKRLMGRLSAMLETADELFDRLRDAEDEYRAAREVEQEARERTIEAPPGPD